MKLTYSLLNLLALAVLAVCAVGPFSSTAHAADAPATSKAADAKVPSLTDAEKLAISKANNDLLQDALQANDLQAKWTTLQTTITADRAKAEQLFNAALDRHGLKPGEWQLDKELVLQPVPKQTVVPPAPTK